MSKQTDLINIPDAITVDGGNVGILNSVAPTIATANSRNGLVVGSGSGNNGVTIYSGNTSNSSIMFADATSGSGTYIGQINYDHNADAMLFTTTATERMRIDSSGNVLVGMTSASTNNDGAGIRSDGLIHAKRASVVATFNRKTSDGSIIELAKDNTVVGSIGISGGKMSITGTNNNLQIGAAGSNILNVSTASVYPDTDNSVDLGLSNRRFDDIFATNGTIQTSDFNEKQDIASLTATEMLVGKRISALFKTFRWKDSVAEKGDNARTHTGVIAQDVQAAFTAEGLDAGDYALFISSTWWETQTEVPAVEAVAEVTDEDGNVTTEAVEAKDAYTRTDTYETEAEAPEGAISKTRMGIRYPELLSFVAAYNEQRFASIEARLTALEA